MLYWSMSEAKSLDNVQQANLLIPYPLLCCLFSTRTSGYLSSFFLLLCKQLLLKNSSSCCSFKHYFYNGHHFTVQEIIFLFFLYYLFFFWFFLTRPKNVTFFSPFVTSSIHHFHGILFSNVNLFRRNFNLQKNFFFLYLLVWCFKIFWFEKSIKLFFPKNTTKDYKRTTKFVNYLKAN